jgi:hypothetical protein
LGPGREGNAAVAGGGVPGGGYGGAGLRAGNFGAAAADVDASPGSTASGADWCT